MAIDWPLPLWQVLREELAELRPDQPLDAPRAPEEVDPSFAPERRPIEVRRHQELRPGLRMRLNLDPDNLLAEVDGRLAQPDLWKSFRDIPESRWVAEQRPEQLEGRDVRRLNRYLLERAFPGAFHPIDDRSLSTVISGLHAAELSALCFSGGGIRSATFGLGVVQALASQGLLDKFDYLSTVSGGGYLGGWLDAWAYHDRDGLEGVIGQLTEPTGSKIEPEPDPIFYLRNFSNYLTPQKGLFSIDTWTLVGIYLRNLSLNWTIILPLLMALLALPFSVLAFVDRTQLLAASGTLHAIGATRRWIPHQGLSFWAAVALLGFATGYEGITRPGNLEDFQRARLYRYVPKGTFGFCTCFLLPLCASFLLLLRYLSHAAPVELLTPPVSHFLYHRLHHRGRELEWFPMFARHRHAIRNLACPDLLRRRFAIGAPPLRDFLIYGVAAALLGWVAHFGFTRKPPWDELIAGQGDDARWARYLVAVNRKLYLADLIVLVLSGLAGGSLLYEIWDLAWASARNPSPRVFILFAPTMIMAVFLATATAFIAFSSSWTDDDDREFWARMGAWMLIVAAGWFALAGLALFTPLAVKTFPTWGPWIWGAITTITGLISTLLSWSRKTPAQNRSAGSGLAFSLGLPIVAGIAIVGVLAGLAMMNAFVLGGAESVIETASWRPIDSIAACGISMPMAVGYLASLIGVSFVMGLFVDVNSFSLHGMYRNRLIRAYLGASRGKGERKPNPFTGFDPTDNLAMTELWPKQPRKLLPVVNISLNLVEPVAEKLAWQERKAESFTVTPLHSGNFRSGYRRSSEYGGQSFALRRYKFYRGPIHSISLGTATAVSGAAVSPNMGYVSSPVLTFLLTLFNVRLGWWLGNPGPAGNGPYWRLARPRHAMMRMLDEALGRTTDHHRYVYLSDGGHFENLGLYEMVLRRCHTIVVIDADEDKDFTFQNLGNAIRKIRIDLGIDIKFCDFPDFRKRQRGPRPTVYCAVGCIRYRGIDGSAAPDGRLIYVKPTIRGDEPADVLNYESSHPDFPHQTTADQWFSESQFESYRALGRREMTTILAGEVPGDPLSVAYLEASSILSKLRSQAQT